MNWFVWKWANGSQLSAAAQSANSHFISAHSLRMDELIEMELLKGFAAKNSSTSLFNLFPFIHQFHWLKGRDEREERLNELMVWFSFPFLWWVMGAAAPMAPPKEENEKKNQTNQLMKSKQRKGALLLLAAVGEWLMKSIMKQQSEKKATSGAPRRKTAAASPSFHSSHQPFNGGWWRMKWMGRGLWR